MTDETLTTAGLVDALTVAQRSARDIATRLEYAATWADKTLPRVQRSTGEPMTVLDLTSMTSEHPDALSRAATGVLESRQELTQAITALEAAADAETTSFQPRPPLTGEHGGRRAASAFVREHAQLRERISDDRKFRIGRETTCRVQFFTSASSGRARPVAVVTQKLPGDGGSLMNRAESLGEALWRTYRPNDFAPPIVVAAMFGADGEAMAGVPPQVYEYEVDDREKKTVRRPVGWGVFLDAAELEALIGQPVELTR
jgi:hypothetical protein